MDERVTTLAAMLDRTPALMAKVAPDQHRLPTPCGEFTVQDLLEHMALWVQVFDAAVNGTALGFDPTDHRVGDGWAETFEGSARSIVEGLDQQGYERPMTMTSDPIPGEFVLNMLLMEYIGHGWDLARSVGVGVPYDDHEAEVALVAARAIIEPQYRGTGMFDAEVDPGADPAPIDRFVAFLGRDPRWVPPATSH
jgi:uncharacterized protein (TIGR03086 family)